MSSLWAWYSFGKCFYRKHDLKFGYFWIPMGNTNYWQAGQRFVYCAREKCRWSVLT